MRPFIGKRAVIPLRMIPKSDRARFGKALTYTVRSMDQIKQFIQFTEDEDDENVQYEVDPHEVDRAVTVKTVNEFRLDKEVGLVSVPRQWALQNFPNLNWVNKTTFPRLPKVKFDIEYRTGQKAFFNALKRALLEGDWADVLANATTGAGKSVAAVWLGLELSTPTLILVDSNKLKRQYVRLIGKLMGKDWAKKNVGTLQQDIIDYKGKHFVIGMVQSIASRKYPRDVYKAFGLVVYDEVQIFGAQHYSNLLSLFYARCKVGLTATNKSGRFGQLIYAHLGKPKVVSKQEVMKPKIYIIQNRLKEVFRCDSDGVLLTSLSRVATRNQRLANIIKLKGYDRDRVCLVLSNRIAHLQRLKYLCAELGIPEDAMGLHVGKFHSGRYCLYYQYGPSGKRQLIAVYDTYAQARGANNRLSRLSGDALVRALPVGSPSALTSLLLSKGAKAQQKAKSVMFSTDRELYTPTEIELDNITNSCQIIFATYEIFSKGVDVPRIDWGMEALPVGNVTQPLGRTLRLMEGKSTPEWYSFHDRVFLPKDAERGEPAVAMALNAFFDSKAQTRMRGFQKSGATIKVV